MAKKKVKEEVDKSDSNGKSPVDVTSIMSQMLSITKLLDERIDLVREKIDVVNTRVSALSDITEAINARLDKVAGRLGI